MLSPRLRWPGWPARAARRTRPGPRGPAREDETARWRSHAPRPSASSPRTPRPAGRRARRAPRPARPAPRQPAAAPARGTAAWRRRGAGWPRAWARARAVAIPMRSPVNVPGPGPDRDPVDRLPADLGRLEYPHHQPQQVRGVARALARERIVPGSEHHVAKAGERHRGGRRCSVEGEDPHRSSIAAGSLSGASGASIVTVRVSPPACSMSTRAATCESQAMRATAPPGHSTNAIRSGPM